MLFSDFNVKNLKVMVTFVLILVVMDAVLWHENDDCDIKFE